MSDQDGKQASAKRRGIHWTNKKNMNQESPSPRPTNDDKDGWKAHWEAQGQSWRTEPEIDNDRKKYLEERRNITPNITKSIYPFKHMKLSRADVEWLLATHEGLRGPIDWNDDKQRQRKGLDLRGADLRDVYLSQLPLAGLNNLSDLSDFTTHEEMENAAVLMQGAILSDAHLEGATLGGVHLEASGLSIANLMGAYLNGGHLEGANLSGTILIGANLSSAHLEGAYLMGAHLEGADLYYAYLQRAYLMGTHLEGAKLNSVFFDNETKLDDVHLNNEKDGAVSVADIHWGDVNVAVVDWRAVSKLGNELAAIQPLLNGIVKDQGMYITGYSEAVRAYRQLSVVLRSQGLNDEANRFAYRAQLMQRIVYRRQRKFWRFLGSLFLDLLSGYGYRWERSFLAYLIVIVAFATAYFIIGHTVGPALSLLGSVVFSMTSFHGRGFFPGGITLDDALTVLAALEAFIGLLIEVTFIATLTRRLFGG